MNKKHLREIAERHQEHILPPYDVIIGMDGFSERHIRNLIKQMC